MPILVSKNPATSETIRELQTTPLEALPGIFSAASHAQEKWALLSAKRRAAYLLQLREIVIHQADSLASLMAQENGKPKFEALANEVVPVVDSLTYFAKKAPRTLRDQAIPLTLMKHRRSYLNYWPLGTVVVISPWNYPLLLPMADILMALVAGNAVIHKPSEATPLIGLKIQDLCDQAGFPQDLIQTVIGAGDLGAALIEGKPAKIFFTGSVETGKKVATAAAQRLIPVNLELGGKDAMIVLADADLDFATSAALWGGFSNSGQVCASTERILIHESISEPFLTELTRKLGLLRQSPSTAVEANDMGPITLERQKSVYERQLQEARESGARFITGGEFSEDRRFLKPTVITGKDVEKLAVYRDETFGPVVAVSTFRSVAEAIQKANQSRYGLTASIITRNLRLGEQIARQLEVGTVTINEVTYTAGLGETPWGGVKESGIGRTHSLAGLLEFVNVRHIHRPRSRLTVLKSLWWFPYTPHQYETFRQFLNLYRRHWTDKIRAIPHLLWSLTQFLKNEPRL